MDNQTKEYRRLGGKTLFILIFKRTSILFILALIAALIYFLTAYVPPAYQSWANLAESAALVLILVFAFFIILIGYLEYSRYRISLNGESIEINRGIIREEEIGVPFRRIKEASVKRGIIDQLLGLSTLVLTVLGEDEGNIFSKESKIKLPVLDKKIAQEIQEIILQRAGVEEMSMAAAQPIAGNIT